MTAPHDDSFGVRTETQCSRAGCRAHAVWKVEWRNPRIHAADRRKVWVACDEHRDFLRDYLAARDFPVQVLPLRHPTDEEPS